MLRSMVVVLIANLLISIEIRMFFLLLLKFRKFTVRLCRLPMQELALAVDKIRVNKEKWFLINILFDTKNTLFNITPPHFVKASENIALMLNICENVLRLDTMCENKA